MPRQTKLSSLRTQLQNQLQLIEQSSQCWTVAWTVIVNDRWFDRQLRRTANALCQRKSASNRDSNADDVIQEVHLLFAKHLKHHNGLNFDPTKANLHTFLKALIRNFCLRALKVPEKRRPPRPLKSPHILDHSWQQWSHAKELRELTGCLPENVRHTVVRFLRGDSIDEIAEHSNCSQRTVYRHLHQATDFMRNELGLGEPRTFTKQLRKRRPR